MDAFLNIRNISLVALLISAFMMTIIPIIKPLRDDKGTGRLNRSGKSFIILAALTSILGTAKIYYAHLDAQKATDNVKVILTKIQDESMQLQNTDFQLILISTCSVTNWDQPIPEFSPIYLMGEIGKTSFYAELDEIGDRSKESSGFWARDPRMYGAAARGHGAYIKKTDMEIRYFAKSFIIVGLENYEHLNDLEGQEISLRVDLEKIQFIKAHWSHRIILTIKGREFSGELSSEGKLNLKISFVK